MEKRGEYLSISKILERAFNIFKDNFLEILKALGIFIIPANLIPIILVGIIITTTLFNVSVNAYLNPYPYFEEILATIGVGAILLIILISFLSIIISLFGILVIVKMLDDANKGSEVSWISATKYVWERKWRLLGLNILVNLMISSIIIAFIFVGILLSIITFGIGAFIFIPAIIVLVFLCIPVNYLFNSVSIVRDLGVIDTMRETFILFKKEYFGETIGRLATISGIYVGVVIALRILGLLPIIGFIIIVIGQLILSIYIYSYLNVFVLDRSNSRNKNLLDNNRENSDSENRFIDPII